MSSELSIGRRGKLVVGHGTRNRAGCEEFLVLARRIAEMSSEPVAACFLELAEPSIAEGIAQLAAQGVREILVVPVLLFSAGHAQADIPDAVSAAAEPLGMSVIGQSQPLECRELLLQLSKLRFHQAETSDLPLGTIVLLVGRGGSVVSAIEEFHRYATLHSAALKLPVETAFMARAEPLFAAKLAELAERGPPCVVVQPHLLFQGELSETIAQQTEAMNERHPATCWISVSHLGPHELVAQALCESAEQESRGWRTS